jgi:septal ring factor EnvC (AmiA/AmiB activator)
MRRAIGAVKLAVLLAAGLMLAAPVFAQNSRETERKLEKIQRELKSVSAERRKIEGQRGSASRQLREADEKVGASNRRLREIETRMAKEQASLAALQDQRT